MTSASICAGCGISYSGHYAKHYQACHSRLRFGEGSLADHAKRWGLNQGLPTSAEELNEFNDAKRRVDQLYSGPPSEIDANKVLECEDWWYVPFTWIGCAGHIVDKKSKYINQLNSGCPFGDYLWGHFMGIYCDLLDFEFASDTDLEVARRIVNRFRYFPENENGPKFYEGSELDRAMTEYFPTFRRHHVFFAVPEIMDACNQHNLQFSTVVSTQR